MHAIPTDFDATVCVIAADPIQRHDLVRSLDAASLRVEGFASADALLRARHPDDGGCILLDLEIPGPRGLLGQEALLRAGFEQPLIVLTGFGEVAVAVRALQGGAFDLIEKPYSEHQLLASLEQALAIDSTCRRRARERAAFLGRRCRLTPREREVMAMIVIGKANKVVAHELGISEKTVETHRAHILDKLGLRSRADIVRFALEHGLLKP